MTDPLELNKSITHPKLMIWPETHFLYIDLSITFKFHRCNFVIFDFENGKSNSLILRYPERAWPYWLDFYNLDPMLCFTQSVFQNRALMFFLASWPLCHPIYISMSPLPQVKVQHQITSIQRLWQSHGRLLLFIK